MNQAREILLSTYNTIDTIDQLLKEWSISYVTWRWWHAPANHAKAIAYTMAFEIYKMCAEGLVDEEWKIDKPMDSPEFRQQTGKQMCEYRAHHGKYPGDEFLRNTTANTGIREERRVIHSTRQMMVQ